MRSSWMMYVVLLALLSVSALRADDWPQWLGPQRDGIWRETGIVEKFPAGGLKTRWRTPIGAGYSGPAVADGKVYITDRILAEGAKNPNSPFAKSKVPGTERVLCLEEKTGKIVWKHEYPCDYQVSYAAGPRTTPVVEGERVYTLGTMGDLLCLNVKDGTVVWQRNLPKDYDCDVPLWGFSASPLLDGERLICLVGGKGSVAVAFHKDTGKEIWKALSAKQPGYAPPMIYTLGGKRQLILWHPEALNALNPETGAVYWSVRNPEKGELKAGMSIASPRLGEGNLLFVTAFYNGPMMVKVSADGSKADVVWRGKTAGANPELPENTDGLHAVMVTPFLKTDHIYGVCSYGELRCLNALTGERLWMTHKATGDKSLRWGNAFLVQQDNRVWLFNEFGDLILAHLSPKAYQEIGRANLLPPTNKMAGLQGPRLVLWSHPAFANRSVYARNDNEIICVSVAAADYPQ